ncbi:DUF2461 domain-containing protein [Leptospira kemamanensis]|uniref:DUF2461 domain-containing protein n=1 Tax=Leptospira kemamanensis TaxID=2484942 RepID=A0A4R9JNF3_9LEPT|nr:DUF2461 domain-containing protein [Leptospira kemamanensis]TGL49745.1 DUF2461 domain-containing protein [Leptospira kemamanensis]
MKLSQEIFDFLSELKWNNNRVWFSENKQRFDGLQKELVLYTANLLSEIELFDESVRGIDPKSCIFRIYKDVRFSKDKSPYKTHFGIFMRAGGKKINGTGYYLHIEPDVSFLGGGCYQPDSKSLYRIRAKIVKDSKTFLKLIQEKNFKKEFGETFYGETVKTAPRGFAKDHPLIEFLKYKGYAVTKKLNNADVTSKDSTKKIISSYRLLYPLHQFLDKAMSESN